MSECAKRQKIFITTAASCVNVIIRKMGMGGKGGRDRMETNLGFGPKEDEKPSLLGMFVNPDKQYGLIRRKPMILAPMALMLVVVAVLVGFKTDFYINHPYLSDELIRLTSREPMLDVESLKPIFITVGVAGVLIAYPLALLLSTGIGWLMIKLFGGKVSFRPLFSFHIHLSVLYALSLALNVLGVAGFGLDPRIPVTSLAGIIPASGALKGLLSAIEVFTIWALILYANGIREIADLPKKQAWLISLLFFIADLLLNIISAAL
jgi:hypothetical protein